MGSENLEIDREDTHKLVQEIEKCKLDHLMAWPNIELVGLLLNPLDAIRLWVYCSYVQRMPSECGFHRGLIWQGMPVRVKRSGPPEIEIPFDMAKYFAWKDQPK